MLGYACENLDDTLSHHAVRGKSVGDADKGHHHRVVLAFESVPYQVLVGAVALAHKPFHAVAVYGVLEPFLWHGDEYGCRR